MKSQASVDRAIRLLKDIGIVVIRRAINTKQIEGLLAAAHQYRDDMLERVTSGRGFEDLDQRMNFNQPTFAADLVALDPETSAAPSVERITETSMFKALSAGRLADLLERLLSIHAAWSMARIRVVLVGGRGVDGMGALQFHQEKTVTRLTGLHNLWTPLTDRSIFVNRDAPGPQFYVGARDQLRNLDLDETEEHASQQRLQGLNAHASDADYHDDEGFLYRPIIKLGDVIIFDRHVPHASYIPPDASAPRISFDIRLFPTPFDKGPKDFPIKR